MSLLQTVSQPQTESKHLRVQCIKPDNTLFVVIPKAIAENLSIKWRDYVKVSQKESKIILEKIPE